MMDALFALPILAQADDGIAGLIIPCCMMIFWLGVVGAMIVGMWKVFEKAGQPGWAALVPFYNMWILTTEIAKKEVLWFILLFVPCVQYVAIFLIAIGVAEQFGKGTGYGIGLALLPFVFYPLLGFGDDQYQGGMAAGGEYAM